jgi:lipoprotein NlpD
MLTQGKQVRGDGLMPALLLSIVLASCASPKGLAPVEDRNVGTRAAISASAPASAPSVGPAASAPEATKLPLGAENAGKPGYYTIKPGDTMIRIGLETGQNWKDLVKWNNLDNPNIIEVGQVLRVLPPGLDPTVATRPINAAKVETRPLDAKPALPAASAASPVAGASAPAVAAVITTPSTAVPAREGDDDINWLWPASGPVLTPFEEGKAKGLAIGGKTGDPVLAAADGKVVYAGSGLRGYGNLVILKHNNTYLTAYAHNQTLLVKEDQNVKRGQKIAEMGSTDADRVQLHFEIRRQGKPVDPARLLPPR